METAMVYDDLVSSILDPFSNFPLEACTRAITFLSPIEIFDCILKQKQALKKNTKKIFSRKHKHTLIYKFRPQICSILFNLSQYHFCDFQFGTRVSGSGHLKIAQAS